MTIRRGFKPARSGSPAVTVTLLRGNFTLLPQLSGDYYEKIIWSTALLPMNLVGSAGTHYDFVWDPVGWKKHGPLPCFFHGSRLSGIVLNYWVLYDEKLLCAA